MDETLRFGPFELNDSGLSREGAAVPVSERGLALLGALSSAEGAVSRDRLLDAAWPGLIVDESNLTVQVSALRKAIGKRADGREWIVTVPRVGYRLQRDQQDEEVIASRVPAVAVLPFTNLTGQASEDYFADGVVEDIITALSRFRSFAVIARNSSFVYRDRPVDIRQVSRELGAAYVLEGSLRKTGDRLRIATQLIRGDDGAHLWARNFDGVVADVFDFQDSIAEAVVGVIEPTVQQAEIERSRRERPQSMAAYDLYLRALPRHAATTPGDNAEAVALVERAIDLAPNFAYAIKVAIDALSVRIALGWEPYGQDDRGRVLELTERLMTLAGSDAALIAQCGAILVHVSHDYERGMRLLARAVELNPNNVDVLTCAAVSTLHCGKLEDCIEQAQRALRLSPGDPLCEQFLLGMMAHAKLILGAYEDAIEWAERARAIRPNFDPIYWILVGAHHALGHVDEARRQTAILRSMRPELTISRIRAAQPHLYEDRLAAILAGLRAAGLPEA